MIMKKYLSVVFILLFAFGCKKGNNVKPTGLTGAWELRSDYGGFAGGTRTYPPGNGTILQFNADSTFISYYKFQLGDHGTYQVVKNGIALGQQKFDGLYYNHNTYGTEIQLKGDTLTLGLDFDDMIATEYVRR